MDYIIGRIFHFSAYIDSPPGLEIGYGVRMDLHRMGTQQIRYETDLRRNESHTILDRAVRFGRPWPKTNFIEFI